MRLHIECITCNIKQVQKILSILSFSREQKEVIMSDVLHKLSIIDYQLCNPEVMEITWETIVKHTNNQDPYKSIKREYNLELMKLVPMITSIIEDSKNPLLTIIKIAIISNVIDFSANDAIAIKEIEKQISDAENIRLTIDDTKALFNSLSKAKKVLYIGDNCGEIVVDKICITILKRYFPIEVYYGVRGKPIINDVTIEDAKLVKMEEVAHIISNGQGTLGTLLHKASPQFQQLFAEVDVIIVKGQGNFEGLSEVDNDHLYHLFMAKCDLIADLVDVKVGDILCMKK